MSKAKIILTALSVVLLGGAFAYANTIIYDNGGPNQQNGNEMTEWVQTEDFTLNQSTNVTDIHFWDIEAAPGYAGSITWWITGDTGGNPDFNNILGTGSANPTRVNTQCGVLGIYCEYSNDWNINPIALQAGVMYHLALHNGPVTDFTRSEFYWETTNLNGTQTGLECDLGGACYNNWSNNGQEHAFYLTGGIPEPGTLVLMGTGLLGGLASLRRRFL
jgi:hypothetical protein